MTTTAHSKPKAALLADGWHSESRAELQRRRASLALDVRTDPSRRDDLAAVEAEIAARRLEAAREVAALDEEQRRGEAEHQRQVHADRAEANREVDRRTKSMAMAARTIEGHLDDVVVLLRILQSESVLREEAGRRAGRSDTSAMRTMGVASSRIGARLSSAGLAFSMFAPGGPPGPWRTTPLDELLGVKTDA